jgi:hypothetical protein
MKTKKTQTKKIEQLFYSLEYVKPSIKRQSLLDYLDYLAIFGWILVDGNPDEEQVNEFYDEMSMDGFNDVTRKQFMKAFVKANLTFAEHNEDDSAVIEYHQHIMNMLMKN